MQRIFILSPASTSGKRAAMLMRKEASFPLALRLRSGGASIGETFSFLSGLYFRGKLAYAQRFAAPPKGANGALVITAGFGVVPTHTVITHDDLLRYSAVDISQKERRYLEPLHASLIKIKKELGKNTQVVLLGSIATGKYVEPLLEHFGERLYYPKEFLGRGDMSRGALMLRAAAKPLELQYESLFPNGIHYRPRMRKVIKVSGDSAKMT